MLSQQALLAVLNDGECHSGEGLGAHSDFKKAVHFFWSVVERSWQFWCVACKACCNYCREGRNFNAA